MLLINNVTKKFGDFTALEDIYLEFHTGIYALLAPNGAGKTTLTKLIVTLLFPTKGENIYDGEDIVKLNRQYRSLIGYLPQDFGYYKNYSPRKYLLYLSALKGIQEDYAKKKIEELLGLVSLKEVKDKKMGKFSGGIFKE